jgi:hypothetical protein
MRSGSRDDFGPPVGCRGVRLRPSPQDKPQSGVADLAPSDRIPEGPNSDGICRPCFDRLS